MPAMASAQTQRTAATPNPYTIFAQARNVWEHQPYPPYLKYDVAVTVEEGGHNRSESYHSAYDATTGAIWVDPVSDYEIEHPASGKGVNVSVLFAQLSKAEPPEDFLGVPMLTPTFSFGMAPFVAVTPEDELTPMQIVAQVRAAFHDPNPRTTLEPSPPPRPGGLREIADITVFKREYIVTLVGIESVDGHACYHLALEPTHARHTYRLRDLWIDTTTAATIQLKEAINFKNGPGTDVPWTITFHSINGAQYIESESADAPMSYKSLIYTNATVDFKTIVAVPNPPPGMIVPATSGLILNEPADPEQKERAQAHFP